MGRVVPLTLLWSFRAHQPKSRGGGVLKSCFWFSCSSRLDLIFLKTEVFFYRGGKTYAASVSRVQRLVNAPYLCSFLRVGDISFSPSLFYQGLSRRNKSRREDTILHLAVSAQHLRKRLQNVFLLYQQNYYPDSKTLDMKGGNPLGKSMF